MRTRNKSIPIRVTEKELEIIDRKAKLDRTNFMIAAALGKKITLIEDLKLLLIELSRVGNNVNQLTRLANSGAIRVIDLAETNEALGRIYDAIIKLSKQEGDDIWQYS